MQRTVCAISHAVGQQGAEVMCTERALQWWSWVGSPGCTLHAAVHAKFQWVQCSGTQIQKLANMSGLDKAGHLTVYVDFLWLLLHDVHMAA